MNNIQHQPIVAMHNPLGFTDLFSGLNQHDNGKPASFDNLLDAWLANDLTQAGLLPPKEEVTSPFLVNSPNNESISDCSHDSTPTSSAASVMDAVPYSDPFVALFPDIGMSSAVMSPPPTPAAVNIKPAAPKAIAPRLANIAPKPPTPIAPRPSSSPLVLPDTSRFTTPSTGKRSREPTRPGICSSSSSSSISSGSDDTDEIALKRQKNTDAARRSRLKKLFKMEYLEKNVSELEAENSKLNTRVAVLESEKNGLEAKERSLEERVRSLEAQLAEAHKALTCIKH